MQSDTKIEAIIYLLTAQRNAALDTIVSMHGEIAELKERIKKLEPPEKLKEVKK